MNKETSGSMLKNYGNLSKSTVQSLERLRNVRSFTPDKLGNYTIPKQRTNGVKPIMSQTANISGKQLNSSSVLLAKNSSPAQ